MYRYCTLIMIVEQKRPHRDILAKLFTYAKHAARDLETQGRLYED